MKKFLNSFTKVILFIVVLFTFIVDFPTFADVGSIQRYQSSSGSSSSSSSKRSSSSSSYSSYSSSGSSGGSLSIGGFITLIVIFAIYMYIKKHNVIPQVSLNNVSHVNNTKSIANSIREVDPAFSEDDFLAWVKEVFIKLQNAWTKREWTIIRPFESNELFEQHNSQLQDLINSGKTNIVERVSVINSSLESFSKDGDKETVKVFLRAVMRDYIIDDNTNKVLEGNPNIDQYMNYRLTFIRKTGVKTKVGTNAKSTTNCPNCGAPTKVTSSGECEYCGSIITTGDHGWVLANLEGAN